MLQFLLLMLQLIDSHWCYRVEHTPPSDPVVPPPTTRVTTKSHKEPTRNVSGIKMWHKLNVAQDQVRDIISGMASV